MDKQDSNEHDPQQAESEEKSVIKKMSIDKYFGKADKTIKFIAFQHRTNLVKQKLKITSQLNKTRYTSSSFQPKFKFEWKPPFYNTKTVLTLMPFNKKSSQYQLQVQCKLNTGFSSSLSINSQRQGNVKFGFSNQFRQIKYKIEAQLERKKQLNYKWGLQFRKGFVHGFLPKHFKSLASSTQFNLKDWKPELKLSLMSQATNQYKFFSQFKLSKQKYIQSKTKFQFQFPKGSCAISTEIKSTFKSKHQITNGYMLKWLLVPKKKMKIGLSIDEKQRIEAFFQQQRIKQLFNSDCSVCLSNRNLMVKLQGKKGKLRFEIGAQIKPLEPRINLIGIKLNYNMDYNSDKHSLFGWRSQEKQQKIQENINIQQSSNEANQSTS